MIDEPKNEAPSASLPTATATPLYDKMCQAIEAMHAEDIEGMDDLEVLIRIAETIETLGKACDIRLRAERGYKRLLRQQAKAKARAAGEALRSQ